MTGSYENSLLGGDVRCAMCDGSWQSVISVCVCFSLKECICVPEVHQHILPVPPAVPKPRRSLGRLAGCLELAYHGESEAGGDDPLTPPFIESRMRTERHIGIEDQKLRAE